MNKTKTTKTSSINNHFIEEKLAEILEYIRSIADRMDSGFDKVEKDLAYLRENIGALPKKDQVFAYSLLSQFDEGAGLSELQRKHISSLRNVVGFCKGEVSI